MEIKTDAFEHFFDNVAKDSGFKNFEDLKNFNPNQEIEEPESIDSIERE